MERRYRTVTTETPCPRCGRPLKRREVGFIPPEFDQPVSWSRMDHVCDAGCRFTADEVE